MCAWSPNHTLPTNLNDKDPELVEIALAFSSETQLPDDLVEALGT